MAFRPDPAISLLSVWFPFGFPLERLERARRRVSLNKSTVFEGRMLCRLHVVRLSGARGFLSIAGLLHLMQCFPCKCAERLPTPKCRFRGYNLNTSTIRRPTISFVYRLQFCSGGNAPSGNKRLTYAMIWFRMSHGVMRTECARDQGG